MSQVPAEINDLMWQIAESMDDAAIEQFVERYPDYRAELMSRLTMVRGIKGSRPVQVSSKSRFLPSPQRLNTAPPRWAAFTAVVFLVAAGVFATLGTLRFIESQNEPAAIAGTGDLKNITAGPSQNTIQQQAPPINEGSDPANNQPPLQAISAMDKPVTIVAKNISLDSALNDIAMQAGIRLESAPGMPDIIIALDFREVPALEVLKALGSSFGFTPMIQTPTSALLIPARDPSSATGQLPGQATEATGSERPDSGLLPIPTTPGDETQNRAARTTGLGTE